MIANSSPSMSHSLTTSVSSSNFCIDERTSKRLHRYVKPFAVLGFVARGVMVREERAGVASCAGFVSWVEKSSGQFRRSRPVASHILHLRALRRRKAAVEV